MRGKAFYEIGLWNNNNLKLYYRKEVMRRFIIFILIYISFYNYCHGTPQMADKLIFKGDTIRIYPFLLEQYIEEHPNKKNIQSELSKFTQMSTGCWRGYQALFELKNDSLFLNKQPRSSADEVLV